MTHKKKVQRLKYIVLDLLSSLFAWFLFFIFRRLEIESSFIQEIQIFSPIYNFEKLLLGIPLYWLFVFWLSGYYNQPFLKSRLEEFEITLISVFLGSVGLFFILLLNDPVVNYTDYYLSFAVLFLTYFIVVYFGRYTLTRITTYNIHHRSWGFNTVIVGCGEKALEVYEKLQNQKQSTGQIIRGFVSVGTEEICINPELILGTEKDLDEIINKNQIEEVIVAVEKDFEGFFELLSRFSQYDVDVRALPRLYDFFVGGVRLSSIYGVPMVNLFDVRLSEFGKNLKRFFDILISLFALIVCSPLLLFVFVIVKATSLGPIIYKQERIGLKGKPFTIYKIRTMENHSEGSVPQLSSKDDKRVTGVGKVLRKYRIDEVPQFVNVLKGDMSVVGPRPERAFFERKIEERVPYYRMVHKVRPGITSWGMVKYGYADSVEQMIERLNYDMIYLENISLSIDAKILIYTIKTVLTGQGV